MYQMSKVAKKKIYSSMRGIIKELHKLLKDNDIEDLEVNISYDKDDKSLDYSYRMFEYNKWKLRITRNSIYVIDREQSSERVDIVGDYGDVARYSARGWETFLFVFQKAYYKVNRNIIMQEVKKVKLIDERILDELDEISKKQARVKEASIEIDLPPSMIKKEIEITRENGQKIGTFNFGDMTVKIVTNGDIVLVNKSDESKNLPVQKIK